MKKILLGLFVAAIVAYWFWPEFSSAPDTPPGLLPPVVSVHEVQHQPVFERLEALGTTRAWEAVDITATVTGKVDAVHFRDNTSVEKGEVVVELDADRQRAALQEAEVNLREARRLLRHYLALDKRDAVSKTLLDEQQSKVAASEARLAAARAELDDFIIRAPFSGFLGVRRVSPGTLVTPGTLITTLDAIDTLKLTFSVPERWVGRLNPGQAVTSRSVAYPGEIFEARITSVGTRVDAATRAVEVQASLANPEHKLKPGMLLAVGLVSAERRALVVDEQAIQLEGSTRFVYRLDSDNRIHRVVVDSGVRQGAIVEVLSGLDAGDRVVAEGTQKVREGMQVSPAGSGG